MSTLFKERPATPTGPAKQAKYYIASYITTSRSLSSDVEPSLLSDAN